MSRTAQDLAVEVLRELRIVRRQGGIPNAADVDTVKRRHAGIHEELQDRGKVWWELDAIPERVFPALARVVAGECAQLFGVEYDPGAAYQRLVILASDDGSGQPIRAEFF